MAAAMSNFQKTDSLDSVDMENEEIVETPYVIQCAACSSVISDSNQCIGTDDILKVFTVNSITEFVLIDKKTMHSECGMDEGCSFRNLKCKKCKTTIGKQYKSTNRGFDHLRDYFSFDVNNITCYQIGSCEESGTVRNDNILEIPSARTLQTCIYKLQASFIEMSDKMAKMEERLESLTSNPKHLPQASPRFASSSPQKRLSRKNIQAKVKFQSESESEYEFDNSTDTNDLSYRSSRMKGSQKRKR